MEVKLILTRDQLKELCIAQNAHASKLALSDHWQWSDDGWDYATAALELASSLMRHWYDSELDTSKWRDIPLLDNYACDGICSALSNAGLNPDED